MADQNSERPSQNIKPEDFSPGGAAAAKGWQAPESLGGGLEGGGQQVGGSQSPAGNLDERAELDLDDDEE
jgi:hypothetical protein